MKILLRLCKYSVLPALLLFAISGNVRAYEHAYKRTTDFIYALARHGMTVYEDPWGEIVDYIPDFEGVAAIGEEGEWYEVRYQKDGSTHYGYVTKSEFQGSGLEYDGREKQIIADGDYRTEVYGVNRFDAGPLNMDVLTGNSSTSSGPVFNFTYQGDNAYRIRNKTDKKYLCVSKRVISSHSQRVEASDYHGAGAKTETFLHWGKKEDAASFVLIREGNIFRIMDKSTLLYVSLSPDGTMKLTASYNRDYTCWRLYKTRKAIQGKALRDFCQYDPEWAHYHYGKGELTKVEQGNYATSGCGAMSTFNAIYSLTGQLPDIFEIGTYAADTGYRIEGAGTDSGYFKVAAEHFGYKYGFKYDGSTDSFDVVKKKLLSGDVAIVYLPGHYSTLVRYDGSKNKYLLLDPYKLPKRGTSEWGNWLTQEDLSSGNLYVQAFFFYRRIDDSE